MSALQFSAQDITRTRICAASNCPDDAINGHCLCERCARRARAGVRIPLHETPPPKPLSLLCGTCREWLPDEQFTPRVLGASGYSPNRRGRISVCRDCEAARRREWRKANRERVNAAQRARRARGGS